jgi:hypothetical protein
VSQFYFDGQAIEFDAGQSVGAALIRAGTDCWRTTRKAGRPRGLFCGIGVCFDCLIVIDGAPNHRACLIRAEHGMRVTSQVGMGRDANE